MPTVLIPLADGFEELEAISAIDLLRRAGIHVTTASLNEQRQVTGSHDISLIADSTLSEVMNDDFDMLVLPGGQPGTNNLNADKRIHTIIKRLYKADAAVAAICAAPLVLAHAGVLSGKRATAYQGVLQSKDWNDIHLSDQPVEVDGNIITSRGPGTALDFSLAIIEKLLGPTLRQQVEIDLLRTYH